MNPIVHAEISWLVAQRLPSRHDRRLVVIAGIAPDLDGLSLLAGPAAYETWHHVLFHGIVGAVITVAFISIFAQRRWLTCLLSLLAFHLHLGCDLLGSGYWPIEYLWPFSHRTIAWAGAWDLMSWQNTLIALPIMFACLASAIPLNRTFVEVFSKRGDRLVVDTIRARYLNRRPS